MKVLLFTSHYPATDKPTRGTYNRNTFNALAKRCEVRVVGVIPFWYQKHQPKNLVVTQHETAFGLDATFLTYWSIPRWSFLHGAAMYAWSWPVMRRLRREFPYDVVIASWAYSDGVVAARYAEQAGVPMILNVLGTDVNELPALFGLRPQIAWALRKAARIVAVSHAMVDRIAELGIPREKVVVQQNAVDGATFAIRDRDEARARLELPKDRPIVLYVGNVQPPKGVEVLVEAMRPLAAQRKDVLLCVVGSGADEAKLRARTAELGLDDNIRFCGRQLHDTIPIWMAACDVFCLPSHMEGCPNVILEALACGRPVVASRVGGIPELIEEGKNGLMAPPATPERLAEALDTALGTSWSPEALRATVKYLSWDAVAETYWRLIQEVTRERRA